MFFSVSEHCDSMFGAANSEMKLVAQKIGQTFVEGHA